jgi:peptidoglycan hydrolase-like protein with peptidoglycan-binding domain
MFLSDECAASMVLSAGWFGEDAVTALAVSFAEDINWADRPLFRIDAHQLGDVGLQDDTWGPSVGTMQIRSLKSEYGTGRQRDQLANLDPGTCYRHAFTLWQAQGWGPWSTWHSGAYRSHLHRAALALGQVHGVFILTRYLRDQTPMQHGDDVRWVQARVYPDLHGVDGWYGPDTAAHVRAFQRSHGLAIDGTVGPATLHALDHNAVWALA